MSEVVNEAQQYGFLLATSERYQGQVWMTTEPEIRRQWELEFPDYDWEAYRDAIRKRFREEAEGDAPPGYTSPADFGRLLAEDMRYQDRDWDDIEMQVRQRWERDHPNQEPWDEVEEAIRDIWRQETGQV